ncbi:hypothetical protein E2562_031530 [Oryza meyeriana var. granulata]|uniref:Uncharacterized protein n=1 Tax=Oryza meyeriana var. granulata TaxID=110450 RepID=A0A6G1DRT2_9ORYZ|nr:hypothetical protein E2562_031530 [Oryza meyeriana var. granulata]
MANSPNAYKQHPPTTAVLSRTAASSSKPPSYRRATPARQLTINIDTPDPAATRSGTTATALWSARSSGEDA